MVAIGIIHLEVFHHVTRIVAHDLYVALLGLVCITSGC